MRILFRWSRHAVFTNRLRLAMVMTGVISIFALQTGTLFIMDALTGRPWGSYSGISVYALIVSLIFWTSWIVSAFSLYTAFSVTVRENRHDFRLLSTGGATMRQVVRSFVTRTLVIDLVCCAVGVGIGVLLPQITLSDAQYRQGLDVFFAGEKWVLLTQTLVMPTMMALACIRFFTFLRPDRKPHISKRDPLRRAYRRRLFGVGSMIGSLSMSHEKRMRRIFALSLAVTIAGMALSVQVLSAVTEAEPAQLDYNIYFTYACYPDDAASLRQFDDVLQDCVQKSWVGACKKQEFTNLNGLFCIFDSASVSNRARYYEASRRAYTTGQDYSYLRRAARKDKYCMEIPFIEFLDDASFDALAAENGAEPVQDGVLLCDTVRINGEYLSVLNEAYAQRTTLYFMPEFAAWKRAYRKFAEKNGIPYDEDDPAATADFGAYLLSGSAQYKTASVQIIGTLSEDYLVNDYSPVLYAPMRLRESLGHVLSDPLYVSETYRQVHYYLQATDRAAALDAIRKTARNDLHCSCTEVLFGVGSVFDDTNVRDDEENRTFWVVDYDRMQADFEAFRERIKAPFAVMLLMMLVTVVANPVQIVYVRRMSMRWDRAILESIGLDRWQRVGMLLYESARVAVGGTLRGMLLFGAIYPFLDRHVLTLLSIANLDMNAYDYSVGTTWAWLQSGILNTGQAFVRTAPIFAVVTLVVFFAFFLAGLRTDRESRKQNLVEILTSNPYL